MTTLNIENKSYIISKENIADVKAVWKEISKTKKATLSHHVFYFLLVSHSPELMFKKAFSPLINNNKLNNVNGDSYFTVKQELIALTSNSSINLKYIEPWLKILLNESEYEIKGGWSKSVKTEADVVKEIIKKAQHVLNSFNKVDGV